MTMPRRLAGAHTLNTRHYRGEWLGRGDQKVQHHSKGHAMASLSEKDWSLALTFFFISSIMLAKPIAGSGRDIKLLTLEPTAPVDQH